MSARTLAVSALGLALFVVLLAVISRQEDPYKVKFELTSANGLRDGTPVKVGGVEVGKIKSFSIGRDDVAIAEAELDSGKGGRVGEGASAAIVTANLIGSKFLELEPGKGKKPSGAVVPSSRVSTAVDIDQVLNVLDADTRTRLQILINEAGIALTGRRTDFNQALDLLPQDLEAGSKLLNEVVADNRALGQTVEHSSRFVERIARERRELSRLIDSAGVTMRTVAERRGELRQTLARAPATLRTLQRFLDDLRTTTEPLGPASRAITESAPSLTGTLAQLRPFERAARPALRRARRVAPLLTRLGREATPVIRRANPTLSSLATFARTSPPVSHALDVSVDDALGIVEGWARSIQNRDGVGHIFRGKATFSADFFRAAVNAPKLNSTARRRRSPRASPRSPRAGTTPSGGAPVPGGSSTRPRSGRPLGNVLGGVADKLLAPKPKGTSSAPRGQGSTSRLLDYLLGP